ncbi:MAG: hypothetical protein LBH59_02770 [Planctomycetaceae bacterium]|nr:hypothetical protein [Planctomycetaceae bacterium]
MLNQVKTVALYRNKNSTFIKTKHDTSQWRNKSLNCRKNIVKRKYSCIGHDVPNLFQLIYKTSSNIPKPVLAVGFALEQTLRDATLAVFSFLILKRLQHT